MRLLVTGANSRFARAVISALAPNHTIRAVDVRFDSNVPEGTEIVTGDLRDRDFAGEITADVDVVLHLAPLSIEDMDDATVVDTFSRGSYNLADMAIEQGVTRFLLGSSLSLFDRLPANWRVDEQWRPRPRPSADHLACWLSELSLRECCHTAPIRAVCLRFGQIVDDAEIDGKPFDPAWLHIEDAVQGVICGMRRLEDTPQLGEWQLFHIASGDRARIRPRHARGEGFGYQPKHDFATLADAAGTESAPQHTGKDWRAALATQPISPRPSTAAEDKDEEIEEDKDTELTFREPGSETIEEIVPRRVVIFGSAGPVAAALAEEIQEDFMVRQTDLRPLADVRAENRPQSEGAPLPVLLPEPHEERTVDVRDAAQVLAACEGMDIIVNCTVVRPDYVEAFRVNTLGTYNVLKAAVQCGIRRVVLTGPQQMIMDSRTGYWWDYDVPGNAPARPGRNLYAHSKFLGQEIARLFTDNYDLEIPVLVYAQFLNPEVARGVWNMAVSWKDSARALRRALEVESLPSSYEEVAITTDLPHGKFSALRAKELLGWEAQDDLSALWSY